MAFREVTMLEIKEIGVVTPMRSRGGMLLQRRGPIPQQTDTCGSARRLRGS
jgi:hypothetical protein